MRRGDPDCLLTVHLMSNNIMGLNRNGKDERRERKKKNRTERKERGGKEMGRKRERMWIDKKWKREERRGYGMKKGRGY